MSTESPLPLALLLAGFLAASPSAAQVVHTMSASVHERPVQAAAADSFRAKDLFELEQILPSDTLGRRAASLIENAWTEDMARQAAHMDPGILWYVEPPAGTNMQTIRPRETVDPEMVRPVPPDSSATIWPQND